MWIKIRGWGFSQGLEPGAVWEGEVFSLPTIWEDKRGGSREATTPTFSALCLQEMHKSLLILLSAFLLLCGLIWSCSPSEPGS